MIIGGSNLLTKSDIGSYTYAGTGFANPHAPTTINGVTYSYDNAGNLTSKGTQTFTWDAWNRLQESANAGTTTAYTYDHTGQRVSQSVNRGSGTTTTIYFNRYYEVTSSGSNSTTTLYVFLPSGELLATIEGNGSATSTYVAHTDHQGGVNVMSDKNGTLAQLATYYPFGAKRNNELPSNGFQEKRGFIGQYEDSATSLSYLNSRMYSGTNGQFLSQDPIARDVGMMGKIPAYILMMGQGGGTIDQTMLLSNPQMLNSYSYSVNNPVTMSDPSGQNPYLIVGGAAFAGSVTWNLGKDFYQNYQDVRAGSLPWYMVTQGRGENPGGRYFKDASAAAVVAMGAVGAEALAPVVAPAITVGGAQVIGATAGGILNAGAGLYTGSSRDPSTGQINGAAVMMDFAAGFAGTRIGQQIPNPAGRPPVTIAGSLGGARAATEQLRVQLGQLVQALGAYVASLQQKPAK